MNDTTIAYVPIERMKWSPSTSLKGWGDLVSQSHIEDNSLLEPPLEPRFEETHENDLRSPFLHPFYTVVRDLGDFTVLFPIASTMQFWAQVSHPRDTAALLFENSMAEEMLQSHLSLKLVISHTNRCPLPLNFCFCIKSKIYFLFVEEEAHDSPYLFFRLKQTKLLLQACCGEK